jgi:hypothetical protein
MTQRKSRYDDHPYHPLCGVSYEILATARKAMAEGVDSRDVDPEQAEALADSMVLALLPWLNNDRRQ